MANVSIVVVSHSAKLGEGLVDLLSQLTGGKVHVASASGLETELGTSAPYIVEVLQSCPPDAAIVLLFDIGSALLSCEMALELLSDEVRKRVVIADAPLVEGAVAAAVTASIGEPVEAVLESAQHARLYEKVAKV